MERDGTALDVGQRIREARKSYGLTQQDLADLVGVSERTIRDIERGAGSPSFRTVQAAAYAVGLSLQVVSP